MSGILEYRAVFVANSVSDKFKKDSMVLTEDQKSEIMEYVFDKSILYNPFPNTMLFFQPSIEILGPSVEEVYKEFKKRLVSKNG